MRLWLRSTLGCALAGAMLALAAPALGDGRPSTPPLPPPAAAKQVAPAPDAAPLRAAPVQPAPAAAQKAAAAPAPAPAAAPTAAPAPPAGGGPRTGQINLADGRVSVRTPAGFEFWPAADAQAYLQRAKAAAPRGQVQGMLAPAGSRPDQANFWGTAIVYEPIGHVDTGNSAGLQAAGFEGEVRAARTAEQRSFEGFAAQPAFDGAGPSLSWAERSAPAAGGLDLRHEQRVLGRSGVVSLTTVARSNQLGAINAAAPDMLGSVSFPAGHRHQDFSARTDQASSYDLPGLITGRQAVAATAAGAQGLAAAPEKAKGAGIQGWFPWVAAGVVVLAVIGWFAMGRRKKETDEDEDEADETPAAKGGGEAPAPAT